MTAVLRKSWRTSIASAVESQSKIIDELNKIIAEKSNKRGLKTKAWLTRDKDNSIWLHLRNKPFKAESKWINENFELRVDEEEINGLNPKWEDEEPIELEIIFDLIRKRPCY